jgi:hypothetical protein
MHINIIDSSNHLIGLRHMPSLGCMVEVLGHGDGQTPRRYRTAQVQNGSGTEKHITPCGIPKGWHEEATKVGYSGLAKRPYCSASCRTLERPLMQYTIRSSDGIQPWLSSRKQD